MKIIRLQADSRLEGIVFDLDNTLYTNPDYAKYQEDVLVARLAQTLGEDLDAVRDRIEKMRADRRAAGLAPTSLGNLSAELGFDIATSVRWREESIEPGEWLNADKCLESALFALARHFTLALVSNNPLLVVEKSLNALGVRDFFKVVVGLDSTLKSKPETEPFEHALKVLNLHPKSCISIGDRFDVDIAPALALGMSGILVSGVEDVYRLPEFFAFQSL
jgi:FMN phosphatase YigB (HAD superfamily)